MSKIKILFFGDGAWAARTLTQVLEKEFTVVGLVLRNKPTDDSLSLIALENSIKVFQPGNVNSNEFIEQISLLGPDLNLSVSYDQILRKPILNSAKMGFINVHAGKLPEYRGRNVLNWAIINGEHEIGVTVHFVDEGIDTGDIIVQHTLPIYWADTYADVLDRSVEAIPQSVMEALDHLTDGTAKRVPQVHLPGTYFAQRGIGDEWLDWSDTSLNIYNKIRAITRPGPGARTMKDGSEVIVWRAEYDPGWPKYKATPGQVVGVKNNKGVLVKTGDSTILINQVEEKKDEVRLPAWRIGSRLGVNLVSCLRELQERIETLERRLGKSK